MSIFFLRFITFLTTSLAFVYSQNEPGAYLNNPSTCYIGAPTIITWNEPDGKPVTLKLLKSSPATFSTTLVTDVQGDGYQWTPSIDLVPASDYYIQMVIDGGSIAITSTSFAILAASGTTSSSFASSKTSPQTQTSLDISISILTTIETTFSSMSTTSKVVTSSSAAIISKDSSTFARITLTASSFSTDNATRSIGTETSTSTLNNVSATTTTSSPQATQTGILGPSNHGVRIGAPVGAVIGILIILAMVILILRRRRRGGQRNNEINSPHGPGVLVEDKGGIAMSEHEVAAKDKEHQRLAERANRRRITS